VVGLLAGYAARKGGARRVHLVELSPQRREAATKLGFDATWSPERLEALSADVVIEASGNPASLDLAIGLVRDEGVIVVASFYGQRMAPVSLGADFHRRRLTLRASQVSRVPPARSVGWSLTRRFGLVADLLQNPALDSLIGSPVPFADAPAAYARLARSPGLALQTVFEYAR
jgi:threonine dehydrogenase-like Zn-dependent dehydrogenase